MNKFALIALASCVLCAVANAQFRSSSGDRYQYDLNDSYDRSMYQIDIDAQHRDKLRLNNTINRNFDRLNGEIGGGYLDD